MVKIRFVNCIFILLTVLSCLAGLDVLGTKPLASGLALGSHAVSRSGLVNLLYILICSSALILSFGASISKRVKAWSGFSILALGFFAFVLFHVTAFDSDYVITVENLFFLTIFTLILFYGCELSVDGDFRKYGAIIFGISYFIILGLPVLIPIKGYDIFGFYDLAAPARHKGWFGTPVAVGFLGLSLFVGSMIMIFQRREKFISWIHLFFAWGGIWGVYFSVHRTSMIAASAVLVFLVLYAFQKKDLARVPMCLFILLVTIYMQFSGVMAAKSGFHVSQAIKEKNINQIVQTNGRLDVVKTIWQASQSSIFGLGTGGTPRYVDQHHLFFAKQPHNDYLRILGDQGLVGLIVFLVIGGMLLYGLRSSLAFANVLALGFCFLTDNLMVLPAYGLGPLLLMGLLAKTTELSNET